MRFKSLDQLSLPAPANPFTHGKTLRDRHGQPVKPKFHIDILTFGEELAMMDYMLLKLQKKLPGAITDRIFKSDGRGWQLEVQILYGRYVEYIEFLKDNNLLDRSMRLGYEEARAITGPEQTEEI